MGKISLKITGLEKTTRRLKTQVGRAIQKAEFSKTIQQDSVQEIRENGVRPELETSTVKYRRFYAANNPTHPDFQEDKSNITFTGSLLNGLRVKFLVSGLRFIFSAVGQHTRLTGKRGRKIGKPISNKTLLGYVNEARPILQIFTRQEFKKRILEKLRSAIRRNFK